MSQMTANALAFNFRKNIFEQNTKATENSRKNRLVCSDFTTLATAQRKISKQPRQRSHTRMLLINFAIHVLAFNVLNSKWNLGVRYL